MHRQDTIRIEELEIFANHGVLPEENVLGQKFLVSCEMEVDIRPAGLSDRIEDSVNYAEVSQRIKQVMTENTFNLIEACAEHVAKAVLEMDERIRGVWIEISKPWAPPHRCGELRTQTSRGVCRTGFQPGRLPGAD